MRSSLIALALGLVNVLAFPPYGHGWLVIPVMTGLLWLLRTAGSHRRAAGVGAAFGVGFFGALFPWIAELGLVAFIPLLLSQTLFTTGYGLGLHLARSRPPGVWTICAVGGWALVEWLRTRVPFGGFGWGLVGLPAGEYASLRPMTAWVGISGWSVVIVTVSALLAWLITERTRTALVALVGAVAAVAVAAVVAFQTVSWPGGETVRVAIVQGSSPCPGTHCADEQRLTYESHLQLTRSIEPGTVDLVVWAESALWFRSDPAEDPEVGSDLAAEAERLGATLMAGADRPDGDDAFIRTNTVFGENGTLVGEYRKTHPVPFGEYVPFRPLFDWIPALSQVPRDMVRGPGPVRFDTGFGPFGSVISFEGSFARYPRSTVSAGADLLVVATSQNSYPYSHASAQLIGITRMHAAALGVDVVHAAITGRSAIIGDGGVIRAQTDLVEPTVLYGEVRMRDDGPTPYAAAGDWLQVLAVAAVLAVALRRLQQLDF